MSLALGAPMRNPAATICTENRTGLSVGWLDKGPPAGRSRISDGAWRLPEQLCAAGHSEL